MNVWCDFHHAGLARAMWYLWGDRLGARMVWPGHGLKKECGIPQSAWGVLHRDWPQMGSGMSAEDAQAFTDGSVMCQSRNEFDAQKLDIVLVTRQESMDILKTFGHPKDGVKYVGVSGNEGMQYDWSWIPNLLATDEDTYRMAPESAHKILTGQEPGREYRKAFRPIQEPELKRMHSYLNALAHLTEPMGCTWNCHPNCPHCGKPGGHEGIAPYPLWEKMRKAMPEYDLRPYGAANEIIGGDNIAERNLPAVYQESALTLHLKPWDGWGHSVVQSIVSGRPVMLNQRLYRYRTAGRYMLPGSTIFDIGWSPETARRVADHVTRDLATANQYARRCYEAAGNIYDWRHEAWRVQRWIGGLK